MTSGLARAHRPRRRVSSTLPSRSKIHDGDDPVARPDVDPGQQRREQGGADHPRHRGAGTVSDAGRPSHSALVGLAPRAGSGNRRHIASKRVCRRDVAARRPGSGTARHLLGTGVGHIPSTSRFRREVAAFRGVRVRRGDGGGAGPAAYRRNDGVDTTWRRTLLPHRPAPAPFRDGNLPGAPFLIL